ncbi:methyltransferase domain-containing protein [Polaribacter sp. R2A056_3_33]|uniref:class I SAM-dependent methyltransferase n=1 Tax=Polaribacter sp. R2A056_3_33 TaxID=2745563 RepID=UPI001C4FACAF|nr:methyltransferase domain-containing protein [Polaribacter sp. R2A056_3_33]QXP71466.1 methyltransferase domain-containing protein [Polaribacter sp. R2A056_3_33]
MKLITLDDFIDTYFKAIQRGSKFFFSKFTFNKEVRTKSAFDNSSFISSNFWSIPKVVERWNFLISGDKNVDYISFITDDFLKDKTNLRLLSLGSGICNPEIELAKNNTIFKEVVCLDIADNLLQIAAKNGVTNIKFIAKNIDDFEFNKNDFDVIFFKASLHHFDKIESLLSGRVQKVLKPDGLLIINEFVGTTRHQFSKTQITAINEALKSIPKKFRTRFKSTFHKNKYRGVGVLRMIMADPSECIDSESIIPSIHKHYTTLVERPYGNNLLMSTLRDISHHFYELDTEKEQVLDKLFALEDKYLKENQSDFVFGIYQNKK